MRQRRPQHIVTVGDAHPTESRARRAGIARRLCAASLILLFGVAGCQENGFRTEVKGNGQGGVEIKRVPKEPAPVEEASAPPPSAAAQSRPTTQDDDLRAKVDALQAQIDRQNQEIQRLKQSATAPATQP